MKNQLQDNGLSGLMRGVEIQIGDKLFSITVMNVENSRKAWVHLQRWIMGIELSTKMNEFLGENGRQERTSLVGMVGATGYLDDNALEQLSKAFATTSSFKVRTSTPTGEREDVRFLKEPGALDAAFQGAFDEFLEWIDVCIMLNFQKQIEKHVAALEANKALEAAKAKPTEGVLASE